MSPDRKALKSVAVSRPSAAQQIEVRYIEHQQHKEQRSVFVTQQAPGRHTQKRERCAAGADVAPIPPDPLYRACGWQASQQMLALDV